MPQEKLTSLFLEQSNDLIWMIDPSFNLVYANEAYLELMKNVTGNEKKLNEPVFVEGFGEGYLEKWKAYYNRALLGDNYEIEEQYYNSITNGVQYSQVSFNPILDESGKITAVACHSKDITKFAKQRDEANRLMNASLDVFCTINEEGNFIYVSAQSESLWGYTPDELIDTPYKNLIIEEDVPNTNEIAEKIINGQNVSTFTNRYRRKDGAIAINIWSARWDTNEKLMFCVARDGREQIENERLLRQSEQRFKAFVQDGFDVLTVVDFEGNYIYASPACKPTLGMEPEEFMGRNVAEFFHPDDENIATESLQKLATTKSVKVPPFRFKHKNGHWLWFETILTNMMENPAVQGIVANSRDITRAVEENHHLKLLQSVITNTKDAILITEAEPLDEPGPRIIYANEAFTKTTGYTAEEVIGKTPRILQGADSDYEELARLSKALRNWESCEIETINYHKNGDEFWVKFTVTPVKNEAGWYTHWISVQRDVTEQKTKELEKELLAQISKIFNQHKHLEHAGHELCKEISDFGKFDLVEFWQPNLEGNEMFLHAKYFPNNEDVAFYRYNEHLNQFKKSEGLQGKIWETKKQILLKDIEEDGFLRKEDAEKIGLKSILGIPLLANNQIVGVLIIGSKNGYKFFNRFLQTFTHLEDFVGSEIKSKRLESDLNHLYESIPNLVSVGDFHGKFLRINKAGCDLLGYTEDEILNQSFEKFVHPDDLDDAYNKMARLQAGEGPLEIELRYITKSGEILWLSWFCNAKVSEGLIYCTAKNITEEKKLKKLNSQAYDLAKVGSWSYDLIGNELFWSDEVYHLHDMDPNSFVPNVENAISFYKEEHKSYVADEIYKSLTEGIYLDYEAVIISKSKKEKWVRVIGSPEFIDGKCVKFIGSFQDTTERREAESRLKNLSDNIPGVVFTYLLHPDGSDEFRYVSKGSEKVWGYGPEEVKDNADLLWDQVKAGGDFEAMKQSISDSAKNKSQWSMRFRIVRADGEKRMLQGLGTPEFLANGTVQYNSVVLDITEEWRNQELLDDVVNLTKMGTWEVNLINNTIFWSDQVHSIYETDPITFQPKIDEAINFYREDYRDLAKSKFEDCIITGEAYDIEAVIVTSNSKERWVRTTAKADVVNGVSTRVYGSFQDITEKKNAEIELTSITERLQVATEAASIGIWDWHIPENKLIWDEKMYAIYNVNPSDFNGAYEAWEATVHPEDIEQASKDLENAINGVSEFDSNFRIIWKDQSVHYIKANALIERDKNGQALRMVGTNLDITKEKIAEQQVLRALHEKNNILESIGDAFFAVDNNWTITYWNKRAESVMGRKREDVIGQNLWDVYPDATDLEFYHQYHAAVKTGEKVNFEEFYPAINIWLDVSAYPSREGLSVYFKDVTQRKTSEEERNKLQKTLENSLNEIYMFDSETFEFNYINKVALHNLGYSVKEIKELTALELKPEYTLSSFRKLVTPLLLKEKERIVFFTNHQRKDGSLYPVEVHLQLIAEGENKNFVAIVLDITERKENEELLKLTTELAKIGSWEVDLRRNTIYWSDMVHQLHGTDPNSFVPDLESAINFYREDFRDIVNQNITNAVKTGEPWDFEAVLVDTNKQEVWIRAIGEAEFIDGECVRLYGSFQNITEIKTLELRLKSLSDDLPGVSFQYRVSPEGEDSRHLTSKASHKIWGVSPEESERNVEIVWDQIKKGGDFEEVQKSIEHSMTTGEKWNFQWRNILPSGELRWHEGFGTPNYLSDGTIVFNSMIFDITERKQAEQKLLAFNEKLKTQARELERSNEELEQFAFITSHDLQEPLRMISSFMDQLKRNYEDQLDEKAHKYIFYATDGAKRMKQIILDLLDYSRAGNPGDTLEQVDLEKVLLEFNQLRRKIISEKSATISASQLPTVYTYRAPVAQILHSLLDNAIKYTKEGIAPHIEINTKENKDNWEFSIKDNGIGIDQEFHDKIFIIFQRLHNRDSYGGTGIGLAIAKKHVEFLGGKIWLESSLGKGSTFFLSLPKNKKLNYKQ